MEYVLHESLLREWTCFKFLHISYILPSPASYPEVLGASQRKDFGLPSLQLPSPPPMWCFVLFCFELKVVGASSGSELESITKILITELCSQ